jgi:hypothetical protein
MTRPTYDTTQDATVPARTSLDLEQRIHTLGVLVNAHATSLDTHDASIAALVSGGAPATAALIVGTPSIAVAAQSTTHRDATIQLKDGAGLALAAPALARVWLSDVAGGAPTAAAPAGGLSFTAGIAEVSETANKVVDVISTAAGVITARLTDATGAINTTWFVNVAIGNQIVSAAVNITNA